MKRERYGSSRKWVWFGLGITLMGSLTYFAQQTPIMSRFDTRLAGLLLCLVGIILTARGFEVVLQRERIVWRQNIGLVIMPISLILTALYVGNTYFVFRQEEVRFANGDVELAGTLLIPNHAGPHPALAMMHGSGSATRMGNFAEAQSLARQGVAVLIYDKRGSGESVGGHYRFDGYAALADDGVAAINFLRHHRDIDFTRVGLWGTSEGGWTAPLAAAQIDDLAFLIIVSGGPITPAEQGEYELEYRLRQRGYPDDVVARALALERNYNAYIETGEGRDGLLESLRQAQQADWFEAAGFPETVPVPGELSAHAQWWGAHMDTDVAPLLKQMDFPILFVLGANDPLIPARLVKTRVENILENAGHTDYTVTIFPEATHNLVFAPANCSLCVPDAAIGPILPWFVPGYLDAVSDWVTRRTETSGPQHADQTSVSERF